MKELGLLHHIYARSAGLSSDFPRVVVGPGDDCGVVRSPGDALLLKVDQVIQGRHFVAATPLDLVARKAIARPLSDIAAMGGQPWAALATAAFPKDYPSAGADELFDAMSRWAKHFGCPLVGGDIAGYTGAAAELTLGVTIVGLPHRQRGPVLRSGAKPGDGVYITGAVGGSFEAATGLGRHLTFEPRVAEGAWLCDVLGERLHAMLDVSDGLGVDGARIAAASGVGLELDAGALPLHPGVDVIAAVGAGEDYELLFTASGEVPRVCPATGTAVTRIGTVREGAAGCVLIRADGQRVDVASLGWEHR